MEVDQIIEVLVTAVNPGFVKVDYEGRPATLQATELTWKPRALDSSEYVKVGQRIRVKVTAISGNSYSISLRQALLGGNPWDKPPRVGDHFFAPVVGITDYGYFVEITYFCHALLLSENTPDQYQIGDRIETIVSSVDLSRHRVQLVLANKT